MEDGWGLGLSFSFPLKTVQLRPSRSPGHSREGSRAQDGHEPATRLVPDLKLSKARHDCSIPGLDSFFPVSLGPVADHIHHATNPM